MELILAPRGPHVTLAAWTRIGVAVYVTGGGTSLLNAWLVDGEDPLDHEEFTDRLMRMLSFLAWAHQTAT
jgi:hypothetical protein